MDRSDQGVEVPDGFQVDLRTRKKGLETNIYRHTPFNPRYDLTSHGPIALIDPLDVVPYLDLGRFIL